MIKRFDDVAKTNEYGHDPRRTKSAIEEANAWLEANRETVTNVGYQFLERPYSGREGLRMLTVFITYDAAAPSAT